MLARRSFISKRRVGKYKRPKGSSFRTEYCKANVVREFKDFFVVLYVTGSDGTERKRQVGAQELLIAEAFAEQGGRRLYSILRGI